MMSTSTIHRSTVKRMMYKMIRISGRRMMAWQRITINQQWVVVINAVTLKVNVMLNFAVDDEDYDVVWE
eukprot:13093937-Ditylum_brightwellii.AAC.1